MRASQVGPAAVGVTAHVSLALGALRPVGLTGHTASSVAAAPSVGPLRVGPLRARSLPGGGGRREAGL